MRQKIHNRSQSPPLTDHDKHKLKQFNQPSTDSASRDVKLKATGVNEVTSHDFQPSTNTTTTERDLPILSESTLWTAHTHAWDLS